MAATALRRLGRAHDALALLGVIEDDVVGGGDDVGCGRFCTERGACLASVEDPGAGRSFGLARAFLLRADSLEAPAALAALALEEAAAAWAEGERTLAISTLERVEMEPDPETRRRARLLRGEIDASDLAFRAQLEGVHRNLGEIAAEAVSDVWLEAETLRTLASVAIDLDERHIAKMVRGRAERLVWTTATAALEHDVFRALAWYEEVRGVAADAHGLFARAAAAAPSARERVASLVDDARRARAADDARAGERLDDAGAAAAEATWTDAPVATLEPLLELAFLYARHDRERSQTFARLYRDARSYSMSPAGRQATTVARERAWFGAVARERGEPAVARGHLQHAFDFWSTVAFEPRAALAAAALLEVGPHEAARRFASERANRWPGTSLQERLREGLAAAGESAGRSCNDVPSSTVVG